MGRVVSSVVELAPQQRQGFRILAAEPAFKCRGEQRATARLAKQCKRRTQLQGVDWPEHTLRGGVSEVLKCSYTSAKATPRESGV